jgi:hypothetical protein
MYLRVGIDGVGYSHVIKICSKTSDTLVPLRTGNSMYDRGSQTVGHSPMRGAQVVCMKAFILNKVWVQDKMYNLVGTLLSLHGV